MELFSFWFDNTSALLADLLVSLIFAMLNGAMPMAVVFSRIYFDDTNMVKCIRDNDLFIAVSADTCTVIHNDST